MVSKVFSLEVILCTVLYCTVFFVLNVFQMLAVTTIQYNTQYRNDKKIKKAKEIEVYKDEKKPEDDQEKNIFLEI